MESVKRISAPLTLARTVGDADIALQAASLDIWDKKYRLNDKSKKDFEKQFGCSLKDLYEYSQVKVPESQRFLKGQKVFITKETIE